MLDRVVANRFDRQMQYGRNNPLLLECMDSDGLPVSVVTKLSSADCQLGGLIRESFAALLAMDLGLSIPKPLVVELTEEFLASTPVASSDVARKLQTANRCAFGSTYCGAGHTTWLARAQIPYALIPSAWEIFAFDALILNPDRIPRKPNLLFDGGKFTIIDHELALVTDIAGSSLMPYPWSDGALSSMCSPPGEHLFSGGLKATSPALVRLLRAWQPIGEKRLSEYVASLPPEWANDGGISSKVYTYLCLLNENLPAAMQEVQRVLA